MFIPCTVLWLLLRSVIVAFPGHNDLLLFLLHICKILKPLRCFRYLECLQVSGGLLKMKCIMTNNINKVNISEATA